MKSQANSAHIPWLNRGAKKRVFVGMSGGVDSSVSAALLQKEGYEVTGVFIRTWQPEWLPCTWRDERRDAMRVAAHLGIPFVTLNLEEEYKRGVADYLIAEYKAGRTPNPDVMCNKEIKFGAFYEWAMKQGADYVATGHYAQNKKVNSKKEKETQNLFCGIDANKDQSYFLWNIRTEQLPHILFPIGHLTKPEVRKLAAKFGLPTAEKKDSQGICFLGMVDMKDFLSHYIEAKPGDVLDQRGVIIGTHPGALLFTLGERHGFTITEKGTNDRPYFVIAKDVERNTITVSEDKHAVVGSGDKTGKAVVIEQTNWIGTTPVIGKEYTARGRYRQRLESIVFKEVDPAKNVAEVSFKEKSEIMTPGQSLVVYDGEVCVGGGVIC